MNIKDRLSFSDRIQMIIKLVGSAEKLANNSGMSARVIGQYLAGKTDPTRKKLIALATAASVNIEWLATGNGPIKKEDQERFDLELIALIIGALDYHETLLAEGLNNTEKTIIILYIYNLYYNVDLSLDQTKFSIMDTLKGVYNLFASFDGRLDTEKSQEQAIKIFTTILSESFSKEGAKFAAEALIGAKLQRHIK
jgi:transcriptional regulator with XRE-family HTH domain